jgi:hypothetical protein
MSVEKLWDTVEFYIICRYLRNDCKTHCDSCYKVRDSCFQLMIKQVHVQLYKTCPFISDESLGSSIIIIHSTVLQVLELGNRKREEGFIVPKHEKNFQR